MTTATTDKGTTVHLPVNAELREKLDQMRNTDRRARNDFIRILIEDEWNRREAQKGNGAQS